MVARLWVSMRCCLQGLMRFCPLKHEALSKVIFAKGAIKGGEWLTSKEVGLYNMEDVLFGKN